MAVCAATHFRNTCKKDFEMVRFTKDVNLRERWLLLLRRSDWKPNENSLLCETHFERDQWTKARYCLKDGAVPALFCTCCCENSCDQKGTSSNEADHTYSKMDLTAQGSLYLALSNSQMATALISRKVDQNFMKLMTDSKNGKKKCSKNSPCNRGHFTLCVMSNSKNNDQTGSLHSSEKERIFYELLEEHVALTSEFGRLTRAYERTFKDDRQ